MFIKELDFLSPSITIYHKGELSHSSWMSGILSLLQIIAVFLCGIYYSLDLIKHREPKAYYYTRFVEDAGFFPVNCSSLFHFISISIRKEDIIESDFDFLSFRIIGMDTYYSNYLDDPNITNIDHWLYGNCDNSSVNNVIQSIIKSKNFNNYEKYACLSQFYDSKLKKYYHTGEDNFRWPNVSHGLANPKGNYYSVFIEKCSDNILEQVFGKGKYKCKTKEEMKNIMDGIHGFHFNFVNQDIDILNYKEPNKKYIFTIENTIDEDNLSINHINLNPVLVTTFDGLVFEKSNEIRMYIYDRNDAFSYNRPGTNIYSIYNIWLKNRMQCYDRTYKKYKMLFQK